MLTTLVLQGFTIAPLLRRLDLGERRAVEREMRSPARKDLAAK